jgi:hypothetical protein
MGTKTQKLSNVVDQIVEWQSVFTGDGSTGITAVAGRGYLIDTTSGTVTVTLPASPKVGDKISIKDYAATFSTNNVTVARNGNNIEGNALDVTLDTNGNVLELIYIDNSKGWIAISSGSERALTPLFIAATGGTVTESGDFKIHTFTGDGCFVVSSIGNDVGSNEIEYLVVAGGGAGGNNGGGGGAGGFRFAAPSLSPLSYPGKPLAAPEGITASITTYPVTVGAGGSGSPWSSGSNTNGSNSVFSTITSAGGGQGGTNCTASPPATVGSGGSGGGGAYSGPAATGGSGNTPPTSPPQGNPGGTTSAGPYPNAPGDVPAIGSGGGAAISAGTSIDSCSSKGGNGGNGAGVPNAFGSCNGVHNPVPDSYRYYAGGGGGAAQSPAPSLRGNGGLGGGNASGIQECTAASGIANSGGGGGGSAGGSGVSGAGGKGIVILRYQYQ